MNKKMLTLMSVSIIAFSSPIYASSSEKETLKLLDLFGDVFEKVREEYVEQPSDKELIEAAINGMLTNLDPHSSYLDEAAFGEMKVQTKGEFGGLGIEVTMKNGMVYVVSPIDDTPAFHAGIESGDYFSHIDGQSVIGMTISDAIKIMRGKPKTEIKLTVLREGEDEPLEITIIRDIIKLTAVRSRLEGDVGYVRITSFSEKAGSGLSKAIKEFKKELGDKLKGIVLDLRNNPGGLLGQAIEVSDIFLDKGEIVSTKGRKKGNVKRFNSSKGDALGGLPIVVLINGGSASASEIVAGALQDHKRAVIMGTRSFGKGSVQTIIPLPSRNAIKVTTSRYYTPSGNSIQAMGIEPDILIEPAKLELLKTTKRTTEENLRGHLNNGNNGADKEKTDEEKAAEAKDLLSKLNDSEDKKEDKPLYERDYPLARAIDLLRGIYIYNRNDKHFSLNQK